jgi:hypothetical protein
MKTLPVCIFTRDRTSCARACVDALLRNLSCTGYSIRYIICDDRSKPGHVPAVVDVLSRAGAAVSVHLNDGKRWGLGASMNKGLEDAFKDSHLCLRIEDDWLLKRPLDLGKWADCMDRLSIGSVRLGMMFRKPYELREFEEGLLKVKSDPGRRFTFNNQVALVSDSVYDLCGPYVENRPPNIVEREMADRYNVVTDKCNLSPWVCWPKGWATCKYYDETMAFDHIGKSTINHRYAIPAKYVALNDPELDRKVRDKFS